MVSENQTHLTSSVRACQNCKKDFTIEPEDFKFYEKIKVPPPTFCPECRLIRRLVWRNERNLYKNICSICKKNIFSVYPSDSPYVVCCANCWWGDDWEGLDHGEEYNFSKPFFEQFLDLLKKIPLASLSQTNVKDSPYCNYAEDVKNVCLSYSVVYDCEDIFYSRFIDYCKQIFDSFDVIQSEKCYENVSCEKNYNALFAYYSINVLDSMFVYDCVNISNCFLCTNLRNQKYCYKNKKYSEEEYRKIIDSYNLKSREGIEKTKKEFIELYSKSIHRFAHVLNTLDSIGEDLHNCKNIKYSFKVENGEDSKYLFRSLNIKDSVDSTFAGDVEKLYEYAHSGAAGSQNLKFCVGLKPGNFCVEYSAYCASVSNVFGCIGLKNKSYCILNKQYTKEEYEQLVPKIIQHMNDMPYIDKKGRIYKYGEFFPSDLSPFAYNESIANEHFPKNKEEIISLGFRFKERENRDHKITMLKEDIPNSIDDISDEILNETLACENGGKEETLCTKAFKIMPEELSFYKRINLPLPIKCPNCRYFDRILFKNPLKLWHRQCMCNKINHNHQGRCEIEFETSYAPERLEIVYCEKCYNQEVY